MMMLSGAQHYMQHDDEEEEDMNLLLSSTPPQQRQRGVRCVRGRGVVVPLWQLVTLCFVAMVVGASLSTIFGAIKNRGDHETSEASFSTVPGVEKDASIAVNNIDNTNTLQHPPSYVEKGGHRTIPKIAWLMSFPNSGTSFTIDLVQTASNMTMASNYGYEHLGNINISSPVQEGGPYWLDADGIKPQHLVLTKTHCGGYCHDCRPRSWVETPHSFLVHCSRAEGTVLYNETTTEMWQHVYDYTNDVDRAIHLIRDPLDNMVSRYHLGLQKVQEEGDVDKLKRYTHDAQGFANFCVDMSDEHAELSDSHIDQHALHLVKHIPCHMDLFRYVQWHNLAFIATQDLLNIPTHILHYNEYNDNFQATLESMLHFLDLPNTGAKIEFQPGKSYRNYFAAEQIAAIGNATRRLASSETWDHLRRYF